MNFAETKFLTDHDQYKIVQGVVSEMQQQNLMVHGAGFCWAMSDLVFQRLKQLGIKSRIVECELTVVCIDPPVFNVIGNNNVPEKPEQIATHVVVITEHPEQPLLIDCSIQHVLPNPYAWVCAMTNDTPDVMAQIKRGAWMLTYRNKIGSQFPKLHQFNIVERIKLDEELRAGIRRNKLLTLFVIVLGVVLSAIVLYNHNHIVQIEDHKSQVQKGLTALEQRADRLDQGITKLLKESNEQKK